MIQQSDLTYNRFRNPPDFRSSNSPQNLKSENGDKKEAKPVKPVRVHPHAAVFQATRNHMDDLVDRLNDKAYLFQSQVSFQVESVKHRPHILMKGGDGELNRFESADDLMELERSLHDMAGFRFSIVG